MRVFGWGFILLAIALANFVEPYHMRALSQAAWAQVVVPSLLESETVAVPPDAVALIRAAEGQVGEVNVYGPAYVALTFPGGDVAPERGVCTDVLIRALRMAHGIDLQAAVNRDMKANFSKYPKNWGLKTTDRNIDHRRVPNLMRFLGRMRASVTDDFLPGNLPQIMIVTGGLGAKCPRIVHNISAGTRVEDRLFEFTHGGHYRLSAQVIDRLRVLQD